jgi:hypothetical protein
MNIITERDGLEMSNNRDGTWTLSLLEDDGARCTELGILSETGKNLLSRYLQSDPRKPWNDNKRLHGASA